jgi:hypothetical protein
MELRFNFHVDFVNGEWCAGSGCNLWRLRDVNIEAFLSFIYIYITLFYLNRNLFSLILLIWWGRFPAFRFSPKYFLYNTMFKTIKSIR